MNTNLEDETITTPPSNYSIAPFIPIAIALVGVILGSTALFINISNKAGEFTNPALGEQISHLQAKISAVEGELVQLNDITSNNSEQIRSVAEQVQRALNDVSRSMSALEARNRPKIIPKEIANVSALKDVEYTNYTIQPGDTFSKIAQTYKTNTQTLLGLNPGMDPKRLQVGQTIKVPSKI